MNYTIEKLKEDDQNISYKVVMAEDELNKSAYAVYLQDRPAYTNAYQSRLPYRYFKEHDVLTYEVLLGVYYKNKEKIIDQIIKDFDLDEDSRDRIYLKELHADPDPWVEFSFVKTPELSFELLEEYLPEDLIVTPQLDDIEKEVQFELERLKEQNVRLQPIDKYENPDNRLNITISRITEEGEDEILNTNADATQLIGSIGIELDDLLGSEVGDTLKINEDFLPILLAQYGPGDYKVTINQIYETEYPQLDDDFAAEVSEFDTLDELTESIRAKRELKRLTKKDNALFDTFYGPFYESIIELYPEPFNNLMSDSAEDLAKSLSVERTLTGVVTLQPIEIDETVEIAINLVDKLRKDIFKFILESEIGNDLEIDEEMLKKVIEDDVLEFSAYSGKPMPNLEELIDELLPMYKAQRALTLFIEKNSEE